MDFQQKLNGYITEIESCLKKMTDGKNGTIFDAMCYSLHAGGKRIRPVITLAVCEALGGDKKAALCFGCALEMVHTYSLIHDDLPCMDNDDLRRGKPTNHKVFGEGIAVLAGDGLLNLACETVLGGGFPPEITVEALRIIYTASGADGMIGGQMLDLEAEKRQISEEELLTLHRKKTGALINAAASLGAICAGKSADFLYGYSSALGLAFQICDDILDVEGDEAVLGKPVNSDERNEKTTFVKLYGTGGAKLHLQDETEKAIAALEVLGENGEFLKQLAIYLLNREN